MISNMRSFSYFLHWVWMQSNSVQLNKELSHIAIWQNLLDRVLGLSSLSHFFISISARMSGIRVSSYICWLMTSSYILLSNLFTAQSILWFNPMVWSDKQTTNNHALYISTCFHQPSVILQLVFQDLRLIYLSLYAHPKHIPQVYLVLE